MQGLLWWQIDPWESSRFDQKSLSGGELSALVGHPVKWSITYLKNMMSLTKACGQRQHKELKYILVFYDVIVCK